MANKISCGKAEWAKHTLSDEDKGALGGRVPVFSLDISPDLRHLATAGGDNTVKIWDFAALQNGHTPASFLLATLTQHTAGVNSVRWSKDGASLCSGSDDRVVLVWRQQAAAQRPRGNLEGASHNKEHWGVVKRLSHAHDVTGAEWSPKGDLIASCDIHGHVCVWNMAQDGQRVHQFTRPCPVKGLAWDPVGRFLAAQDEEGVIVWNVQDGKEQAVVKSFFEKSSSSVFFRRLSWSPDGNYVCATNGLNRGVAVAPLLTREDITNPIAPDQVAQQKQKQPHFVGHRKPVIVARWNPRVFRTKGSMAQICAVASKDRSISVWMAGHSTPVLVMKDMFSGSVLDLSWSADGTMLVACAYDGTVGWINFAQHACFSTPLSDDEFKQHMRSVFGSSFDSAQQADLPESAVHMQQPSPKRQRIDGPPSSPVGGHSEPRAAPSPPPARHGSPNASQKETRTKLGKRRITPMLVSNLQDSGPPSPFAGAPSTPPSPSAQGWAAPASVAPVSMAATPLSPPPPPVRSVLQRPQACVIAYAPPPSLPLSSPSPTHHLSTTVHDFTVTAQVKSHAMAYVSCAEKDATKWEERIGVNVRPTVLHATPQVVVVASSAADLLLLHLATGRRLAPPLRLPSPAALIASDNSHHVVVLTQCCTVFLFNTQTSPAACVLRESARSVVCPHRDPNERKSGGRGKGGKEGEGGEGEGDPMGVDSAVVVERHGENKRSVLLLMSDGSSFVFSYDYRCWVRVGDPATSPSFPASAYGVLAPAPPKERGKEDSFAFVTHHSLACVPRSNAIRLARLHDQHAAQDSAGDAETKMASALALGSGEAYCRWARTWVECLASGEAHEKIEQWLRSVIDFAVGDGAAFDLWEPCLLGVDKEKFLEDEIFPSMGKTRALQRVVDRTREYLKQRKSAPDHSEEGMDVS